MIHSESKKFKTIRISCSILKYSFPYPNSFLHSSYDFLSFYSIFRSQIFWRCAMCKWHGRLKIKCLADVLWMRVTCNQNSLSWCNINLPFWRFGCLLNDSVGWNIAGELILIFKTTSLELRVVVFVFLVVAQPNASNLTMRNCVGDERFSSNIKHACVVARLDPNLNRSIGIVGADRELLTRLDTKLLRRFRRVLCLSMKHELRSRSGSIRFASGAEKPLRTRPDARVVSSAAAINPTLCKLPNSFETFNES